MIKKERLGDILLRDGAITKEQLDTALSIQQGQKKRLGRVLIELEIITEEDLCSVLSRQLNIPKVDLTKIQLSVFPKVLTPIILRKGVLPLVRKEDTLIMAMVDPLDVIAIDDIARLTKCKVRPVLTTESQMSMAIKKYQQKELEEEIKRKGNEQQSKFAEDINKERLTPFKIDSSIFLQATKSLISQAPVLLNDNIVERLLLESKIITKENLEFAKSKMRQGERIGDALIRLNIQTKAGILSSLSKMLFSS
jgi:type IV pilus assembly protein PilB